MDKHHENRTYVFLGVYEFGDDLDSVTEVIDVAPSEAWVKGDPLPKHPSLVRKHSRWTLDSGLPSSAPFEEQIVALLDRLKPIEDGVRRAAAQYEVGIQVAMYWHQSHNPGCLIPPEVAGRLAELGLDLDLDIYCCYEDEPDPK